MARSPFVADISGLAQAGSSLISDQINQRLQERALSGDKSAMVSLSSRDPRAAAQIGDIFQADERALERDALMRRETQAQADEFKRRIARSFSNATTPEAKKEVLKSVIPSLQGRQGFEGLISDIEDDIARFETETDSVIQEYAGANVLFDTQEQLKARKSKDFANGAVLNVLGDGSAQITDERGNLIRQGQPGYEDALKRAFNSEIELAGAKSAAVSRGKEETEGAQLRIQEARQKLNERLAQASKRVAAQDFDADIALSNIDKLLQGDTFADIYGKVDSLIPDLLRSQESVDALALRDQVVGLISLESREKLKGQGTITDEEAKTLERSATILANPSISNDLAREELNRVKKIFSSKKGAPSNENNKDQTITVGRFTVEVE